jgi:hypothetical protein
MWLMTKVGFYSIVQKQPGEYHVRSRERKDIENLMTQLPLDQVQIIESKSRDYAFRIIVKKEDVEAILKFLGETINYDNFKNKVDQTPDQKHKPYHEVWGILADALGAYGRKPRGLKKSKSPA